MLQLCIRKLSQPFGSLFTRIERIHTRNTRQLIKSHYFLPRVDKTAGQKRLSFDQPFCQP